MKKDFSQAINAGYVINFVAEDNKVRVYCHITGKYRGSGHWSCNINGKLTKKVSVIFNNFRGYGSRLIMQEISKFDVKVNILN